MATRVFLVPFVGLILTGCGTGRPANRESPVAVADVRPEAADRAGGALFVEFVATPQDVVERMLEIAAVRRTDTVYDLGCGDGRIVITAARRYSCHAVGYDLDPLRVREARANVARRRLTHLVAIEQQDVLQTDLQGASVVALYLSPEINARLIPQLEKLAPGSRIVAHDFPIGNLRPDRIVEMTSHADGCKHRIYLWTCPLTSGNR